MLIDARGQGCPKPVMMAEEALSKTGEGIVDVLVDNEDSALNVAGFAAQNGLFAETVKEDRDWKVKIVKGYACEPNAEHPSPLPIDKLPSLLPLSPGGEGKGRGASSSGEDKGEGGTRSADSKETKKGLLLVVGTDVMGKEEELGKTLMKAFFETMKVYRQLPHTMFFLNKGVNLTTVNSDIVGLLKDIEKMGVEIYSCGTCLKQYNFESELKVGRRGTMNIVVEGMQDFEKVVWM